MTFKDNEMIPETGRLNLAVYIYIKKIRAEKCILYDIHTVIFVHSISQACHHLPSIRSILFVIAAKLMDHKK